MFAFMIDQRFIYNAHCYYYLYYFRFFSNFRQYPKFQPLNIQFFLISQCHLVLKNIPKILLQKENKNTLCFPSLFLKLLTIKNTFQEIFSLSFKLFCFITKFIFFDLESRSAVAYLYKLTRYFPFASILFFKTKLFFRILKFLD